MASPGVEAVVAERHTGCSYHSFVVDLDNSGQGLKRSQIGSAEVDTSR